MNLTNRHGGVDNLTCLGRYGFGSCTWPYGEDDIFENLCDEAMLSLNSDLVAMGSK